jgi:hypothetical protein
MAIRWRKYEDPRKNPFLMDLIDYGDPWQVAAEIDGTLERMGDSEHRPTARFQMLIGKEWILAYSNQHLRAVRMTEVYWIYREVAAYSSLSKERFAHSVMVRHLKGMDNFDVRISADDEELHQRILRVRPEVFVGFRGCWRDISRQPDGAIVKELADRKARFLNLDENGKEDWIEHQLDDYDDYPNRHDRAARRRR